MEFNVFIKTFPFNTIRWSGRLVYLSLRSLYQFSRFLLKSTSEFYSNFLYNINRPCERILILGPRNSGKSSILYRMKLSEFIATTPTGSIVEEELCLCRHCLSPSYVCGHKLREYDKIKIRLYELGYNDSISTYQQQIQICNKIIYVIDSFGDFRYSEMNKEILTLISEHNYHHRYPKYVVFLNKNDIFGSMNYGSIKNALEIPEQFSDRSMVVKGSALTGNGISEALSFLLFDKKEMEPALNSDLIVL